MLKAILSTLGIFFLFTITTFAQCEINDLVAMPTDCDVDGNFFVEISFSVQNPISGTFFITNGNQGGVPPVNYGEFEYGQASYTVGPLVGDGVSEYGFMVFDSEDIFCGAVTVVDPINCTLNCAIANLDFISFTNCNADNEYFVEIEFLATNASNDGFTVTGNGMNYGIFEYGQASYFVGPFLASSQASYEIIVMDVDDSACQDAVFFDSQLCNGGPCTIENTFIEYLDCNNDDEFYIQVGFEGENLVADFYQIFIDNNYVGNFSTDEPFYELGPLAGDGSDYEILVRNIGNASCVLTFEVVGVECGNDCELDITVLEVHECDEDGNFLVDFEIEYSGQGDEGFTVFGNGMNYGNFEYGQTFYTVGPFAGDGASVEVIIQDLEVTDCQTFTGFNAPDCGVPNLVWPGDLNNDNIANNLDLLNLGLAFNSMGEPRDMQGIEWSALPATEWDFSFENGVNYVFADANGDGTAGGDDQNAIEVNYDLTHGDVVESYDEAGDETDPELFVDLPSSDLITIGQPFTAPIILGTNDIPVGDIYGLAFTLVFDPIIIDIATVEIDYSANWMGQNGVNILTLDKKLAVGEVDIVITKNDQNNVGGFGQIAAFIGIIDNIAGKTKVEVQIKDVRAINRGEETVFLQRPIDMIEVTVSTSNQLANNDISIYPNPTMDGLIIANSQDLPMTSVEIRNAAGKLVAIFENGDKKMDVSGLPSGVYLLKFEIGGRMYYERFVRM